MQYGRVTKITENMVNAVIEVLNEKFNTDKFKMVDNPFSVGNPFSSTACIYISENNKETHEQTLMEINYLADKNLYYIRIGTEGYTRWSGGLEYSKCWFGGSLKTITKETFKECFDKYFGMVAIYENIGCGNEFIEHIKLDDVASYAEKNNLEIQVRSKDYYSYTNDPIDVMDLNRAGLKQKDVEKYPKYYSLYPFNEYAI